MNIFLSINRTERSVHYKGGVTMVEKITPEQAKKIHYAQNPTIKEAGNV